MGNLTFDIVILVVLALFAWRGASKGLILSLCGLLAVFVCFFAAQVVSNTFCEQVGGIIRPVILQSFHTVVPEPQPTTVETEPNTFVVMSLYPPMEEILASIQEEGLFQGFSNFLEEGVKSNAVEQGDQASPIEALAGYLANGIAKTLLFSIVYFGGLLAWFLLSHALDLAFKLPVLAEVNLAGGLAVGLAKGALVVVMLVWVGQLVDLVPNPPETPVLSLFTVDRLGELLSGLPA